MTLRDELLARLSSRPFDLLIIGGSLVGAGIARDASIRGLRGLLTGIGPACRRQAGG